ncbi:MAG: peptidyl-prolyl cis-trans isomerase, partial [Pseudomonadota bacterium]
RIIDRIVFGTEDEAAAAKARLEASEIGFDALAAERGLQPGDIELGERAADALNSAERDAIFGADGPGIVGPVITDLGPALFRLNAILAEQSTSLEEATPTLREELALIEAGGLIGEEIDPVQDLLAGGAPLEEIADESPMVLGTIRISERLGEGLAADPAFRAEAQEAEVGEERDLIDIADDGIAALRVDEIVPPTLQPFEDVAETLPADWRIVAEQVALRDYAESLRTATSEARTFEAVMQEAGLGIASTEPSRRNTPPEGLPAGILPTVFGLEENGIGLFETPNGAFLIRLDEIIPFDPDAPENATELEARQAILSNTMALDLFSGFAQSTQNAAGVSVNQTLIEQTLALYP